MGVNVMEFVFRLKKSVEEGDIVLGVSKVQDWFELLSMEEINNLSKMLEDLKNDNLTNADQITTLVYLLCQIENFDLYGEYKGSVSDVVLDFSYMVSLEILRRHGYVRFNQKLSFSNLDDSHIELIKTPPPHFGFNLNLN